MVFVGLNSSYELSAFVPTPYKKSPASQSSCMYLYNIMHFPNNNRFPVSSKTLGISTFISSSLIIRLAAFFL